MTNMRQNVSKEQQIEREKTNKTRDKNTISERGSLITNGPVNK